MTSLGFTGRSSTLPTEQLEALTGVMTARDGCVHIRPNLRHGVCVGADAEAHVLAKGLGWRVIGHPGPPGPKRADLPDSDFAFLHDPLPFLDRNQVIVDTSVELIAVPDGFVERLRDGCWATVRRARKAGLPITFVWPDGTVTREGNGIVARDMI